MTSFSAKPARPWALIADPGLTRTSGHHFNAAVRLRQAVEALDLEPRILADLRAWDEVVQRCDAKRAFTTSPYRRRSPGAPEFGRRVAATWRDLIAALGPWMFDSAAPAPSLIILPTCDQVLAKAVARYVETTDMRPRPAIVAWILLPPETGGMRDRDAILEEVRDGYRSLIRAIGDAAPVRIFCETGEMAELYGVEIGIEIGIRPSESLGGLEPRDAGEKRGQAIRISALGHATFAKGYDLLPEAIGALEADAQRARFHIHAAGVHEEPALDEAMRALSEMDNVDLVREDLTEEAYNAFIASADIILVPYDPAIYATRGSGVFNEAERLGIPTVAPSECDFARAAIAEGRATPIVGHDAPALAAAIRVAMHNLEENRARCATFAKAAGRVPAAPVETVLQAALGGRVSQMPSVAAAAPAARLLWRLRTWSARLRRGPEAAVLRRHLRKWRAVRQARRAGQGADVSRGMGASATCRAPCAFSTPPDRLR